MSNYTKSPWSINNWPQNGTDIAVGAVGTPLIAKVPLRDVSVNEQKANETEDGPKAAAFDWLMDKIQEAYDLGGWLEVGDMIVTAHSIWGQRDECCVKAEIQWKDRRDEPLDLLSAIEQAKKTEGGS